MIYLLAVYDICGLNQCSWGYTDTYEKAVAWKRKMTKEHPLKDKSTIYGFEVLEEVSI